MRGRPSKFTAGRVTRCTAANRAKTAISKVEADISRRFGCRTKFIRAFRLPNTVLSGSFRFGRATVQLDSRLGQLMV
jgi:hypothetical protein